MNNMVITVEFLCGTSIQDAVFEAKRKAIQWDVAYVQFDFNKVRLSIGQTADWPQVEKEYANIERKASDENHAHICSR